MCRACPPRRSTDFASRPSYRCSAGSSKRPLYRLHEPEHGRGLARLPQPSEGDVFFDFEGDPWWGDDGLEYLFGTVYREDGEWRYWPLWAETRAEEKARFEEWMDWITARLETHPDLHIFHFNSYEPVAIKRLMSRHATREHEVDELLRRKVFVDLYGVVRQAMRVGTESYGLKALEPVFGFTRDASLREAIGSLRGWQAYLDGGDRAQLDAIADYNDDDCRSTLALRDWLMDRRDEAEAEFGVVIDQLEPEPGKPLSDSAQRYLERLEALRPKLTADLPDDESLDDPEQRARRLTFDLLGYHRREAKPGWWEFFSRLNDKTPEQLRDEDSEAIGDLTLVGRDEVNQSWLFTMSFPEQEFKLAPGGVIDHDTGKNVTIADLDESARTLQVRRGKRSGSEPPRALFPGGPYNTDEQEASLLRFADRVVMRGLEPCGALDSSTDLLRRRPPRFIPGTPPLADGPVDIEVLRRQVAGLDRSALFVQGPPGLRQDVDRRAARGRPHARAAGASASWPPRTRRSTTCCARSTHAPTRSASTSAAGRRPPTTRTTTTTATASPRPRQPPADDDGRSCSTPAPPGCGRARRCTRPSTSSSSTRPVRCRSPTRSPSRRARAASSCSATRSSSPTSARARTRTAPGASVLEHLLGEHDTVPADRGVFLDRTWRMHPEVCGFVSRTMYDGRLHPIDGLERQRIDSVGLSGAGLRLHRGRAPRQPPAGDRGGGSDPHRDRPPARRRTVDRPTTAIPAT